MGNESSEPLFFKTQNMQATYQKIFILVVEFLGNIQPFIQKNTEKWLHAA